MKKRETARRESPTTLRPSREHWWWRDARLKRALNQSPHLDRFFYWRVKGRKSPDGATWTPAQRRNIETGLWLYELDARISRKYLFGKPAHLLSAARLPSVVSFVQPIGSSAAMGDRTARKKPFSWAWIEYYDKRNLRNSPKLTRAELNGIIAAMKYCMECFLHR